MGVQSESGYTSTPPLHLHGMKQEELYLYLYQAWSRELKLQDITDEQTMLHRHLKST
jgi:hypothetical protein